MMRQQEQQKLAEEQLRSSTLIAEKEALEQKLASSHKVTGMFNLTDTYFECHLVYFFV